MCTTACSSCRVTRAEPRLHQRPGYVGCCSTTVSALGRRADVHAWFTATEQVASDSMIPDTCPPVASVYAATGLPQAVRGEVPRLRRVAQNLATCRKARATITTYDQISQIMGRRSFSVLLGAVQPKAAARPTRQANRQRLAGT